MVYLQNMEHRDYTDFNNLTATCANIWRKYKLWVYLYV